MSIKYKLRIIDVFNKLSTIKLSIIKDSYMFDFFENKKIGEYKIGFRFIFQSNSRTLNDKEIDNIIIEIIEPILQIDSVSLPGV